MPSERIYIGQEERQELERGARKSLAAARRSRLGLPSFLSLSHLDREFGRRVEIDFILVRGERGDVFESIEEVEFDGCPQRWRIVP